MTQTTPRTRRAAPSVVAALRDLMPLRPLGFSESLRLAELQANRLLQYFSCDSPPLSEELLADLPRIHVRRVSRLINSGASKWGHGAWRIRINAADPITRQRFTLCHELKHVLDASVDDMIYGHLREGPAKAQHVEAICDHFAACLLMPKLWVRRLWTQGVQDIAALAWRFEVSQQAMLIRLQVLGLVEPQPRCENAQQLGGLAIRGARNSSPQRTFPLHRVSPVASRKRPYSRRSTTTAERKAVTVA